MIEGVKREFDGILSYCELIDLVVSSVKKESLVIYTFNLLIFRVI